MTHAPTTPAKPKGEAALVSNADLDKLVKRIGGLDKTQQDSVHEALVYVRGTYERRLTEMYKCLAVLLEQARQ